MKYSLKTNVFILITGLTNIVISFSVYCKLCLCIHTFTVRVICIGSLVWYWHICPPPNPVCTPSLARLRASRAKEKRVGVRLAGWHQSPGEQADEGRERGRHLPTAAEKLQVGIPPGISADGWERNTNAPHWQI